MQCSAWRPTSSASTSRAAAVEQDEVELLRAVAVAHAGPQRRVRVHPLARSRSAAAAAGTPRGPATPAAPSRSPSRVTSTSGSVGHMRPLPSDSTTPIVPVSAIAEVRARDRDRHREELLAQVHAARPRRSPSASSPSVLARARSCARTARGSRRGCGGSRARGCATACRSASWTISSARSVSIARDALGRERLVEADLVRRQRLDLDDLVARRAPRAIDATIAFASAPSRAQCTVAARARDRRLQALQLLGQRRHRARLDRRARVAQRLPVGQLRDRARALGADHRRRLADVAAQLGVLPARLARGRWEAVTHLRRQDLGQVHRPHAGALAAQRAADVHQARLVGRRADLGARVEHAPQLVREHRHRRVGVLDRERAAEPAALAARSSSSTRSMPRTARSSRRGRSPTLQQPQRVARRVQRHPVRERRADVDHAEHVDQELRQLEARGPRPPGSPLAHDAPTHDADGETTAS